MAPPSTATKSLCPACLQVIGAQVLNRDGEMRLYKSCAAHGEFECAHPWSDPRVYQHMKELFGGRQLKAAPDGLVINLNSRCNQNCPYCFARANEFETKEPSVEDIRRKVSGFRGSLVYLSGGEPTLRPDLFDIIRCVKTAGYKVVLFTNGKKLAEPSYAMKLAECGVDLVVLQFDALDERQSEILRGEKLVATKLRAVAHLRLARIPVYLFVMLVKGVNVDQVGPLLAFAARNSDIVKVINFNPVWNMGRIGRHDPLGAGEICMAIEAASAISLDDFLQGTATAYHLSTIRRQLTGKGGNKHPWCEIRCYALAEKGALRPLSHLLDAKALNSRLQRIVRYLDGPSRLKGAGWLLRVPYFFIIKALLASRPLRASVLRAGQGLIASFCGRRRTLLLDNNVLSVIVGTFHDAHNVDLHLLDTCNLYSDAPEGEPVSACLRQIRVMDALNKADPHPSHDRAKEPIQ